MNTSFEKKKTESSTVDVITEVVQTPVPGVTVETQTTIAAPAAPAVAALVPAKPQSLAPGGIVLGDKLPEMNDIILPRINIVQFIGELKDSFTPGSIVFAQNTVLFVPPVIDKATGMATKPGTPPIHITVLGFRPTRFVERVTGGGRGMIVNTEAEVRANGGTLDFTEFKAKESSGMKRFEQLAEALVAIQRPEHLKDDDTVFVYEVEGKKYALGLWGMKGTSYTHAAKRIFFTARALGCLRKEGYPSYGYSLTTRVDTFAGNSFFVPVCVPAEKSTPAFMEFVAGVLCAPVETSGGE